VATKKTGTKKASTRKVSKAGKSTKSRSSKSKARPSSGTARKDSGTARKDSGTARKDSGTARKKTKRVTKRPSSARAANLPRPVREERPSTPRPSEQSQKIALWAAQAGLEKKATEVEIIDVTGKVDYADYLVLMTGQSDRNVAAIADSVDGLLSKNGVRSMSVEGLPVARWVLIDFVDVVVHVFQQETRALYDLDGLWMDAKRVPLNAKTS
jgi:ribosome-associated protein